MTRQPIRIAIVGAGPAGLMLALTLLARRAQRAFARPLELTILEREDDHAVRERADPDRSYTIDVTGHGRWAVAQVGESLLERFDRELIPFRGIVAHPLGRDMPHEEGGWTGSRGDICCALEAELADRCARTDDVEVVHRWRQAVELVDGDAGRIRTAQDADESFDLLVAADGAGSTLRRALETSGALATERSAIPNYSRILQLDRGDVLAALDPSWLHLFSLRPWAVGGAILAPDMQRIGAAQPADAASKLFFVQMGYWNDAPLAGPEDVRRDLASIRVRCRDGRRAPLTDFVSDAEIAAYATRAVHHTGKTVLSSRLVAGRCVLLGDAAAAFPPVGQGVNAAMESAVRLGDELAEVLASSADPAAALLDATDRYDAAWRPQAAACADIAAGVRYGSRVGLAWMFLLGVLADLSGVELAGPQLAKDAALSYVEARAAARRRGRVVLAGLSALLIAALGMVLA